MRIYLAITILLCLTFTACGGGSGAPTDIEGLRKALAENVRIMELGINREDMFLTSRPVSDEFLMGQNIAIRYVSTGWGGKGIASFRAFFGGDNGAFEIHANILQTLELTDIDMLGDDIAQAVVLDSFSSVRVDRSPPEINPPPIEPYRDLFVFQREGGSWKLILWDEAPIVDEHDQGGGETS